MTSSPTIKELAAALAAAQAEIKPPQKTKTAKVATKTGPGYSYQYCDLADLLAAVLPPLTAHQLSVSQGVSEDEKGMFSLTTRLMHGSGEWLQSGYPLAFNGDAQQKGSELTYARRYALSSLLGVAPEDDRDGQGAGARKQQSSDDRRHRDVQRPEQRVERQPSGEVVDQETGKVIPPPRATGRQVQDLRELLEKAKAAGLATAATAEKWHQKYRVTSFEELSSTDCMRLIQTLRGKLDAAPRNGNGEPVRVPPANGRTVGGVPAAAGAA